MDAYLVEHLDELQLLFVRQAGEGAAAEIDADALLALRLGATGVGEVDEELAPVVARRSRASRAPRRATRA